ncbi:MAG: hypothetical protein GSR77_07340 [Desulfurococcales archaeon]|nr:hypothetical protein [Desulfurococcales archaeon]
MPVEIKDLEKFVEVTARAVECRVKKSKKGNVVKVKARTKRYLYTYKTTEDKLSEVLGKVKCKKIVYVDEGKVEEKQ